ncbi:MAG: hypothetical protein HOI34_15445 [Rhodospirillaceae bacterium]|jgi:hypothetical protein|nr:hypothetical protein [Rhodospirillaceae bacterium]MBT6205077.1 hypothetical protein [Rhodospirillaceae bacterium]MBT6513012.1 hypothetical protein [Rhodospirillaceae bacterium]MBT7611723.1 hypothetical protein [Rhodospirillaceae bacterium]
MSLDSARPDVAIRRLAMLSDAECRAIRDQVHALRPDWTARDSRLPFHTLGSASYLDAPAGRFETYSAAAGRTNAILGEHFAPLLDRLRATLEPVLGGPVRHDPRLALPGFHVFLADPAFTRPVADVHYDLQFEHLDWSPHDPIEPRRQLSMTLAIRLPHAGAGLRVWDIDRRHLDTLSADERSAHMQRNHTAKVHDYRTGELALHSGYLLHQIEPARGYREDDERITLQAHAMPAGDGWILYW